MPSTHDQDHIWHRRAAMALASVAETGRTITYADLADAARIPAPHRINKLTQWLEATMREDHAAGRPLRAALVISRNRGGLPAPGFFQLCGELGLYQASASSIAAAQFHQTMLDALRSRIKD
jgi:hypothetical protein